MTPETGAQPLPISMDEIPPETQGVLWSDPAGDTPFSYAESPQGILGSGNENGNGANPEEPQAQLTDLAGRLALSQSLER